MTVADSACHCFVGALHWYPGGIVERYCSDPAQPRAATLISDGNALGAVWRKLITSDDRHIELTASPGSAVIVERNANAIIIAVLITPFWLLTRKTGDVYRPRYQ